jgi:hypothetical protein
MDGMCCAVQYCAAPRRDLMSCDAISRVVYMFSLVGQDVL